MERAEEIIDLKDLFKFLYRKVFIIIIVTGVFGIAALLYAILFKTPVYKSTTTLFVTNTGSTSTSSFMLDCIEIVQSSSVASDVVDGMGIDKSYKQVLGMLSVNNPANTRALQITIKASDPEFAQKLASAYASAAQNSISERLRVGAPEVIEVATVNPTPVSPNTTKIALLGLIGGFVLSCGFYVCKYMLDDSVKKLEDVERLFGIKALASIPCVESEVVSSKKAKNSVKNGKSMAVKTSEKGGSKR